jgi:hypothetical protein
MPPPGSPENPVNKEFAMLYMAPFTIAASIVEMYLRMAELIWCNGRLFVADPHLQTGR